jgi:hypothetical protein
MPCTGFHDNRSVVEAVEVHRTLAASLSLDGQPSAPEGVLEKRLVLVLGAVAAGGHRSGLAGGSGLRWQVWWGLLTQVGGAEPSGWKVYWGWSRQVTSDCWLLSVAWLAGGRLLGVGGCGAKPGLAGGRLLGVRVGGRRAKPGLVGGRLFGVGGRLLEVGLVGGRPLGVGLVGERLLWVGLGRYCLGALKQSRLGSQRAPGRLQYVGDAGKATSLVPLRLMAEWSENPAEVLATQFLSVTVLAGCSDRTGLAWFPSEMQLKGVRPARGIPWILFGGRLVGGVLGGVPEGLVVEVPCEKMGGASVGVLGGVLSDFTVGMNSTIDSLPGCICER